MQFDLPIEQSSIIKVIGVGGCGSNAVNYMYQQGIHGVNFVVCNTDAQSLEMSPVPIKIQLGAQLTGGLGAGTNPDTGRKATEESLEEISTILGSNTRMVFITAGMGGGTGTGGAPVIAKLAKELGILTVGIVTTPFRFEGISKTEQAIEGIKLLSQYTDSLIIIANDKLKSIYGRLNINDAYAKADSILANAAKSIAEIITVAGKMNVDFADVKTTMQNSGMAIMGIGMAEGENRATKAVAEALNSPLLIDFDIHGTQRMLVNIRADASQYLIDEQEDIFQYIEEHVKRDLFIKFGFCNDNTMGNHLMVTVVATGFDFPEQFSVKSNSKEEIVLTTGTESKRTELIPSSETTGSDLHQKTVLQLELPTTPVEEELRIDSEGDKSSVFPSQPSRVMEWDDIQQQFPTLPQDVENELEEEKPAPEVYPLVTKSVQASTEQVETGASSNLDVHPKTAERASATLDLIQSIDRNAQALSDLERIPAYVRRQITGFPRVSGQGNASDMSKYVAGQGSMDPNQTEFRKVNPYFDKKID